MGSRDGRQTVSLIKACELVDVSRRTMYAWIRKGKVEAIRTAGGSQRIFVDTLYRPQTPTPAQEFTLPASVDLTPSEH